MEQIEREWMKQFLANVFWKNRIVRSSSTSSCVLVFVQLNSRTKPRIHVTNTVHLQAAAEVEAPVAEAPATEVRPQAPE